jgi:hypothetical protein
MSELSEILESSLEPIEMKILTDMMKAKLISGEESWEKEHIRDMCLKMGLEQFSEKVLGRDFMSLLNIGPEA